MIQETFYVRSDSTDPWHNLALEEQLLLNVQPGQCILYLWQNQHTVVIGRNQNAWAECRTQELEASGGKLARRLSGGGAVYHDLGNLNFTFLVRSADYDVDRQLSVIRKAIRTFGLDAQKTGRNDITVDGRKISGNAFYKSGDCCYHHGTILVGADMDHLSRYLQVSREKLQSKGVASVRSRVMNLREKCPEITIDGLCEALVSAFAEVYGTVPGNLPEGFVNPEKLAQRTEFFSSWDWRYGTRTEMQDQASGRFPWGGVSIHYTVRQGHIAECALWSDGLEADFLASLPEKIQGLSFDPQTFTDFSNSFQPESEIQGTIVRNCMDLLKNQIA